jgi:hypothetical protein
VVWRSAQAPEKGEQLGGLIADLKIGRSSNHRRFE